ncbi:glutamate--cysteine ligase, partial [Vibrio sp. 812(2023)]|nr:glutamate--cysteine ligase [Vibrio sp. 812(2023)]
SLDVNPFSAVGVSEEQVRFLDLFLTWAALSDSDPMDNCELECWRDNWNKVIISGREKGLMLQIGCQGERLSLQDWAKRVFVELRQIAVEMDSAAGGDAYQAVCDKLEAWIDNPELTISGQLLELTKELGGLGRVGCALGMKFREENLAHGYQHYSQDIMETEVASSVEKQRQAEESDTLSFDEFLENYFAYLK